MAATVIDQLVVTLGLNSAEFKKGAATAKQGLSDVAAGVNVAGESVMGLATKLGGLAALAIGIGDLFGYFKHLTESVLPLKMMADNLGMSAKQLLIWGETAKYMGGQTGDAISSINNLQQALFNLRFKGQMSEQLVMLQRLGVQFMDSGGKMRDFKDIAMDTSKALQRAGFDEATRYQYAISAGFTGGIATDIAKGPATLADSLGKVAAANKSVSERQLDSIAKLDQSILLLRDKVDANSLNIVNTLTPALYKLVKTLNDVFDWISKTIEMTFGPESTLAKVENYFITQQSGPSFASRWGPQAIASRIDAAAGIPSNLSPADTAIAWLNRVGTMISSAQIGPIAGGDFAGATGFGSVNIDTININTRAMDANGIAADITGAIKRKAQTVQSDTGITP